MNVRLSPHNQRLFNAEARHYLSFPATAFLLIALAVLLPERFLHPFNQISAAAAVFLLDNFGYAATHNGTLMQLDSFRADVITECTVLYPAILYGSFLLCFPASMKRWLQGISVGLPMLFFLNTVRLAAVAVAGAASPQMFEILHVYLGQIFMVLAVCLLAFLWLRWSDQATRPSGRTLFFIRLGFWSVLLFIPWLLCNRQYVILGDQPIAWIFSLSGHPLHFSATRPIYYQTFNVVTFTALLLASRLPFKSGLLVWLKGFFVLWLGHEIFRVCNVLLTAYGFEFAFHVSILIHIVGQYLLPIVLWLWLANPKPVLCTSPTGPNFAR